MTADDPISGQRKERILLGHLNSNGDCLYATTVARQIKNDHPGCHLTWAIGSMCRKIINHNPHVDEVWEIPMRSMHEYNSVWTGFEKEALQRKAAGEFDQIFFTQIAPGREDRYDGCIRSAVLKGYPGPITVPVAPVLQLSSGEVENVRQFAVENQLAQRSPVILFECSPKSGQSFMTPEFAMQVAGIIAVEFPNSAVLLSSDLKMSESSGNIMDVSVLSLRENAELTKYATMLVGCSSGITWICTSDWARPLPMVQLISPKSMWVNSVVNDHTRWGLPTDQIIEMTDCSADHVFQCIKMSLSLGVRAAKQRYHEVIADPLHTYVAIGDLFFERWQSARAIRFLLRSLRKNPGLALPKHLAHYVRVDLPMVWRSFKARFTRGVGRDHE